MLPETEPQDPKDMNNTADESEETLSLCDLPLYSDQSADWDQDYSLASNSSYQEDYFEFFSQELRPSAAAAPPENIIFCGRLIPSKQELIEIKNQTNEGSKRRRWRLFRWKFVSKNGARGTTTLMQQTPRRMYNTKKRRKGTGRNMSGLFLFGVSRFPPAVELSDMRGRRSRRGCAAAAPPPAMFGFENRDDEVVGGGVWWLIRALSCG